MHVHITGTSIMDARQWMLSVEGEVVMRGTDFIIGLSVLFAIYYVLNMKYEPAVESSLEFMQRYVSVFTELFQMVN